MALFRRDFAGNGRRRRIRRGHRVPLQLALTLFLLLFLLLEFLLALLKLEIRFCQRVTFQAEDLTARGREPVGPSADFGASG